VRQLVIKVLNNEISSTKTLLIYNAQFNLVTRDTRYKYLIDT